MPTYTGETVPATGATGATGTTGATGATGTTGATGATGATGGMVGVPTADGMIIGIKSGGASSYASSRMLGAYVSTTLATTPPYPATMPIDMAGGTLNASDALILGRVTYLPAASNVTLLESSLSPAYGSTFGTKKVGMTFHVGTKQQITRRVAGLSYMSQSDNVNAVIVGYMGSGPRILLQDYDLATDETDSIRLVAKQVVLNGGMTVGVKNITDANTTLDHTYHVVLCNGTTNYTVTLPDARRRDSGGTDQETNDAGRMYHIKKRSASTVSLTLATTSSQTIDGSTTLTITQQYNSLCLVSDGSNWNII